MHEGQAMKMRFTLVPFSNKNSSFPLNTTIKHHLYLFPPSSVAEELSDNLYMDDFLSGADNIQAATCLYEQAKAIMNQAGMELTK